MNLVSRMRKTRKKQTSNMARFRTGTKKRIEFGFGPGGVGAEAYKQTVGHYHTGVDYKNGYGTPIVSDNFGRVYKVERPDSPSGWQGVYYYAWDAKEGLVEICQGHLSEVYVKEGDLVFPGKVVGLEGNFGEVYSGGVRITKEMRLAGDKRGSHCHEQFRPFKKVKKVTEGKHYLNKDGKKYKDAQGFYFEISYDNDTRGCVNPYQFLKNSI